MRVVQINAIYGSKSTGTIVREIQSCCEQHGIEGYVAYSISNKPASGIKNGYRIGNKISAKWHALISRLIGKQAYSNHFTTWLFLRWLDNINPDIVHLHNLHSNFIHLNMLLHYLAKHDIATVITMHDCWYFTGGCMHYTSLNCDRWKIGCGKCPKRKQIPSYIFDKTHSVLKDRVKYLSAIPRLYLIGVSEWIANELRQSQLKNLNITFIHNGFDLEVFKPSPSEKRKELKIENKFVILGPASKWLLEINRQTLNYFLSHMESNMVLLLFGCATIDESLPKDVIQVGYISKTKEMAELYSIADVMVNCSREDTLSSINLECQACGTPVITYDATGNKETINGSSGFAVLTGEYIKLYEKVLEIKQMEKETLGYACRNWIKMNYNKDNIYDNYVNLYQKIVRINNE